MIICILRTRSHDQLQAYVNLLYGHPHDVMAIYISRKTVADIALKQLRALRVHIDEAPAGTIAGSTQLPAGGAYPPRQAV